MINSSCKHLLRVGDEVGDILQVIVLMTPHLTFMDNIRYMYSNIRFMYNNIRLMYNNIRCIYNNIRFMYNNIMVHRTTILGSCKTITTISG